MFPFHVLPVDIHVLVADFLSLRDAERWCVAFHGRLLHILTHARYVARQRRRIVALERVLCYQADRYDVVMLGVAACWRRRLAACLPQFASNVKRGRPTMLYERHPLVDGAPMCSLFLER